MQRKRFPLCFILFAFHCSSSADLFSNARTTSRSSQRLKCQQLEAELGVRLFARQRRKVELTEAGRALCEQVDSLLQRAEALQQAMRDIVAGEAGHLSEVNLGLSVGLVQRSDNGTSGQVLRSLLVSLRVHLQAGGKETTT